MENCWKLLEMFSDYGVPGKERVAYSRLFIDKSEEEKEELAKQIIEEIKAKYQPRPPRAY